MTADDIRRLAACPVCGAQIAEFCHEIGLSRIRDRSAYERMLAAQAIEAENAARGDFDVIENYR